MANAHMSPFVVVTGPNTPQREAGVPRSALAAQGEQASSGLPAPEQQLGIAPARAGEQARLCTGL
jgi:hypothetical protein